MILRILFITLFLIPLLASSQLREKEEMMCKETFRGVIGKNSEKRKFDKRSVEKIYMELELGDVVHFNVRSIEFNIRCEVWRKDSFLRKMTGREIPSGFGTSFSHRADTTDSFTLVIYTIDSKKDNEYRGSYIVEKKKLASVTTDSLYCDKIEYLLIHCFNRFKLIMGEHEGQRDHEEVYRSKLRFNREFPGKFYQTRRRLAYENLLHESKDSEEAFIAYENGRRTFNDCLAEYGEISTDNPGYAIDHVWIKLNSKDKIEHATAKLEIFEVNDIYRVVISVFR
ncbi:MAG: hypothetical protein IH946_09430 [Bacteroidetes bacterium]|nr:hypothetical protein [Bacteroidota bacterium]